MLLIIKLVKFHCLSQPKSGLRQFPDIGTEEHISQQNKFLPHPAYQPLSLGCPWRGDQGIEKNEVDMVVIGDDGDLVHQIGSEL